jgi:hypothetical protein
VHLWTTAITLIKKNVDTLQHGKIEEFLRRAEKQSGVMLTEAVLRQAILAALQSASQSLLCREIASALRTADVPLEICGKGWTTPETRAVEPWTLSRRIEQCRRAQIVLHVDPVGTGTQDALLVAGAGAVLIARRTEWQDQPGGLATLLTAGEEFLHFGSILDLLAILKRLVKEPDLGPGIARRAQARCRQEHTALQRLAALRAILSS